MNTFNEVDKYLKNLELKTYSIKEIADIIRNIDSLTKEGLFVDDYDDDFYKDIELIFHPETGEKINVEDCYVDLTYQRVLKLKQLVDQLRATDKDGNRIPLGSRDEIVNALALCNTMATQLEPIAARLM